MPNQLHELVFRQPVVPGNLFGVRLDRFVHNDFVQPKPVRADGAGAPELEHEPWTGPDPYFLLQLPGSGLFIGLGNLHCTAKHPIEVARKSRCALSTAMHKRAPFGVTAHDRGNAVQPSLPNRVAPAHDSQNLITVVNPFNKFAHEPQDVR